MEDIRQRLRVPVEKLRWRCDPSAFPCDVSAQAEPLTTIIGQERAIEALRLGLEIKSPGYNVFVTGLTGTGRTTAVKKFLDKIATRGEKPTDKCYVHNFRNPDVPIALTLPAGMGRKLQKDMNDLINTLLKKVPLIFQSEAYTQRTEEIVNRHRKKEAELIEVFRKKVEQEGFALMQVQVGPYAQPALVPLVDGQPVPLEQLETMASEDKFPKEKLEHMKEKMKELSHELESTLRQTREIERRIRNDLKNLEQEFGRPLVEGLVSDLKLRYPFEKVHKYLDDVAENILENLQKFQEKPEEAPEVKTLSLILPKSLREDPFLEYRVNLLVDNSEAQGPPVIIETTPTYRNLFGTIERVIDRFGVWRSTFMNIKAGSLLAADGGYLVFNAMDALEEFMVWRTLKRALKNRQIDIAGFDPMQLFYSSSGMKPEPFPIDVKVVMLGDDLTYHLLYVFDDDFQKIFKVKADFDSVMDKDEKVLCHYSSFIRSICENEKLKHCDRTGMAAITEYGVRLAGRKNKISTRFSEIADIIREASYWADRDGSDLIKAEHVEKAIDAKRQRLNLLEDKIKEMIDDGILMIDTTGETVGQVNGLAVIDLGDYSFAKPTKITARTSMGRAGLINIEREAKLSGKTHDKGMLILEGYVRGKYAQDKPLTLSASICFEQSYSGVDGDSASSTEVYALLSSISGLPIKQSLAVTGSVNQKGEIQAIGAVNQKIEGFFDACRLKGLTGDQGVLIPASNVEDLMLRKDVVEAVERGQFHIYAIRTIDEGIELLTGVPAGERDGDGSFPEGTVNYLVDKKLGELAKELEEFGKEEGEKETTDTAEEEENEE